MVNRLDCRETYKSKVKSARALNYDYLKAMAEFTLDLSKNCI